MNKKEYILICKFIGGILNTVVGPNGNVLQCDMINTVLYKEILSSNVPLERLQFKKDWRLLMPIVEYIESIIFKDNTKFSISINKKSCIIKNNKYYNHIISDSKIESTYLIIIDFIKWYNKNKL